MYIGTSTGFFDLDEVKFIIIKDHFAEIKFKKSYFEDKEDTLYVDLKLNDLEFEMIKAKIAKDEKFVNI